MIRCISYLDAIRDLGLSECATMGVISDCSSCNHVPWNRGHRYKFQRKLEQATDDIKNYLDFPICDEEICDERHPANCSVFLKRHPVAYLGIREEIETRELSVAYTQRGKCILTALPSSLGKICKEDDLIGYTIIENIPDGVTEDDISFEYVPADCAMSIQKLEQPCLQSFLAGADVCGTIVSTDGFLAYWPKCNLMHPNCDTANIGDSPTQPSLGCWIQSASVSFWQIDESAAIRSVGECTCGACGSSPQPAELTIELIDQVSGEVCIRPSSSSSWVSGCSCPKVKWAYINYGANVSCIGQDSVVTMAVSLRTLLLSGKNALCGCSCFSDDLDWWMQPDPGEVNRALTTPANYPFGTTRAGVEIASMLLRLRDMLSKRGETNPDGGMLSIKSTTRSWRDLHA